ncbi:MAG TPA: PilC/PilY family type IV pilus protein [Candidatus Aminicenantes bacterium]|nr:PilC/PilY family type IV pilus protein [Candidatus Aminicenantes bacterium]
MNRKGLNRQGSLWVLPALAAALAAGLLAPRLWPQAPQACTEYTRTFSENFDTPNYKDTAQSSVAQWPTGPIILPPLGSNFVVGAADRMGRRIYQCAAGDFNGDGYPDLIGLDITGEYPVVSGQPWSELRLIKNIYPTNRGALPLFSVDMSTSFDQFNNHTGPAAITVGDYNGDGLLDFFLLRNSADEFGYTNFRATMYINRGTAAVPSFRAYNLSPNLDFTSRFQSAGIYLFWAANHLCTVDIDKDGDLDILVASQDRIYLLRNPGRANFTLANWTITELAYDARTGYTGQPGTSVVSAGDFDFDGDIDVVCGSVGTAAFLAYYENDGAGHFTRSEIAIPNPTCVGAVGILADDFTGDGRPDMLVVTDSAYRGGSAQARLWILRNRGLVNGDVDWLFQCLNGCASPTPSPYDIDMATALDYDRDGDMDAVIADANHSGDYYFIENRTAGVYETFARATSTNIGSGLLDPRLHAVTRIRVTDLRQGFYGPSSAGLTVEIKFSNNGGQNWETYQTFTGSGIANRTNLPFYDFKNFGADLRWRIVLSAPDDHLADYPAQSASLETPFVDSFALEFVYVDRREYSRSSAAATVITQSGLRTKVVIGASFIFPGFEGQLRAYDMTGVTFDPGTDSQLRTVATSDLNDATGRSLIPGAGIFWDAGQLLNGRNPDSRTIYTALRANGSTASPLVRTNFVRSNVGNPATAGSLAWCLKDVNNDNAGLVDFVRGRDRYWKLGDINHSTPVVVGPPDEDSAYMGTGYAEFKTAYSSRPKVIYVGANDGMLHCFDIRTGEELWGFIPYNLLPILRNMYVVDSVNGARYYAHDVYCDGSPAVADVEINGQWRTVLVTGQGPGKGSVAAANNVAGAINYYWALDVTDPADPQPLWEISHTYKSGNKTYPSMGETWSTPAIGKVNHSGTARWVALMGSGYDNVKDRNYKLGRRFYVVRLDNGTVIRATDEVNDIDTSALAAPKTAYRYPNIAVAIPGSPTAVDLDGNGFTDYVYVGDLDGRLYRMNLTGTNPNGWGLTAIYTDHLNYPIVTKPGVWVDPLEGGPARPRVYFGTGGDDAAPADRDYSFVCLIDNGTANPLLEWYLGVPARLNRSDTYQRGTLGAGQKVWANPVIADQAVYFSTLTGGIEAVNPCQNLGERGRLYARSIRATSAIPVGGTAFKSTAATPPEYLDLVSKARRAVTVGEVERVAGRVQKREIYVQEFDSTLEKLEQPVGSLLRIKSWREIYRIIW